MKSDISVVETGGASIVRFKPLFSRDCKYLLCPCGNVVKVFSISTGECFQRLMSHTKLVTGISHHPKVKLQVLSCSLDGSVKVWDYEDGVLLNTCTFLQPLLGIFMHSSYSASAFITKIIENVNELYKFDLITTQTVRDDPPCHLVAKNISQDCDKQISLSASHLAINYYKYFCVFPASNILKSNKVIRHNLNPTEPAITCLSSHPKDESCVTGHQNGEIRVWFNITNTAKTSFHIKHWHSLSVQGLTFTSMGSMILSGGHESVLVQWKEDGRDFLPRLGCEISNVVVSDDSTLYATCHTDNSILIITNYFVVKQAFEGFTAANQALPCGLQYDQATGACVANGKPGHLLFYFPSTDAQLYNLDIVSRNFISSVDLKKPLSRTIITQVAFTRTETKENQMATLEFDQKGERDQKLKFWIFDETEQSWSLETVVSSPHSNKDVTSLNFHPFEALCASTSTDGLVKIWIKTNEEWFCDETVSYRNLTPADSAFSEDGSLLAIVLDNTVAVCDPMSVEDLTVISSFPFKVKSVVFGRGPSCHLMIIVTSDQIHCWNMISCSLEWYSQVPNMDFIVQDGFSENMAAFTKRNFVHVFRPSDKTPIFSRKLVFDAVAACFVPNVDETIDWMNNCSLYIISKNLTVHKLSDISDSPETQQQQPRLMIKGPTATPMSGLLSAKIGIIDEEFLQTSFRHSTIEGAVQNILNTPVHVLPPMSMLCGQFISSLLFDKVDEPVQVDVTQRQISTEVGQSTSLANNDVTMDEVLSD